MSSAAYDVVDTLFLWFLGQPERPVLVGELNLVQAGRGVSLRYAGDWLHTGFALSEDLPRAMRSTASRRRSTGRGCLSRDRRLAVEP